MQRPVGLKQLQMVTAHLAAPVAVMFVSLLACMTLYRFVVEPAGRFSWDESAHAVYGVRQALHLQRGELLEFWREGTRMGWAFLHAWMLAPVYLIFGVSAVHARAFSLLCLGAFVLLLYLVTSECAVRGRRCAGVIAALFALTSPEILLYACKAMLEIPALAVAWLALYVYLRTLRDPKSGPYFTAGALTVAAFFTRYDYGLALMAAILVIEGVRLLLTLRGTGAHAGSASAARLRDALQMGMLFVGGVSFWWFYNPGFARNFANVSNEMVGGYVPYKGDRVALNTAWLLIHPTFLARDYSASLWTFGLTFVGMAAALRRWWDLRRVTLLVFFAIGYCVAFRRVPYGPGTGWWPFMEHARYLVNVAPVLWVLAGLGLAELGARAARSMPKATYAGGVLVCIIFAGGTMTVYSDIVAGRYAALTGSSATVQPYFDVLARVFSAETEPIRVYMITAVPSLSTGEVEWQIRQASPSRTVQVLWPPWPQDPPEGHVARLRWLVDAAHSNWIVATDSQAGGADRYVTAAAELSEFRLVTSFATNDAFVLRIYRRSSSPSLCARLSLAGKRS